MLIVFVVVCYDVRSLDSVPHVLNTVCSPPRCGACIIHADNIAPPHLSVGTGFIISRYPRDVSLTLTFCVVPGTNACKLFDREVSCFRRLFGIDDDCTLIILKGR